MGLICFGLHFASAALCLTQPAHMHELSGIKELLLTLTMRSLPQVTIRPLDGSMSMWAMLCFPSWNVASGVRLHTQWQHFIRVVLTNLVKGLYNVTKYYTKLNSLFFFDGFKAGVTHPHRELKAHDWKRRAFGATFSTHGLAALPAVVLHTGNKLISHCD